MKPVIYIDVLFLVNFFINCTLLLICTKILKRSYRAHRLFLGSALGAIYAVCMFFPKIQFMYTLLAKFIMSLLIVSASFKIVNLSLYIKTVCTFYLASFTLGGGLMALVHFTNTQKITGTVMNNGIFYFNLPFGTVLIASLIAYILISIFCRIYKESKSTSYKEVCVYIGGKHTCFRALIDTGNMLSEPISNTPVMVVELEKLRNVLPEKLYDTLESADISDNVLFDDEKDSFKSRIRIIPYTSLGEQNGLLMGFKPDSVTVSGKCITNIIIGVYNRSLSVTSEYDALLNPEILSQ